MSDPGQPSGAPANGAQANGAPAALAASAPPTDAEPELEVTGVEPVPRSVEPTLGFWGRLTDASGLRIYTIALTATIMIEPGKRSYSQSERERLFELFGTPERWAATTGGFRWAQAQTMVHPFSSEGEFGLRVPVSYDLEIASAKYFGAVEDGDVPLRFHFNGQVLYERGDGKLQAAPIPWDRSVRFQMPIEAWQRLAAEHHPHRGWIPLHTDTVARIEKLKAELGAPTFDDCLTRILDKSGEI
ncbi:DUF6084 family protein [soil metagenome]